MAPRRTGTRRFAFGGLAVLCLAPVSFAQDRVTAAREALRAEFARRVESGARPTTYIDLMGRRVRGRVTAVDERGLAVSAMGTEMRLPWEKLFPRAEYALLRKMAREDVAGDHLVLAWLAAEAGMKEDAAEAAEKATALDVTLEAVVRGFLPEEPAAGAAARPADDSPPVPRPARARKMIVAFALHETLGVSRRGETATVGLPLPRGRVRDVRALCMLGPNGPVPCQFEEAAKWQADGSARWVLCTFRASVGAKGGAAFQLAEGDAPEFRRRLKVSGGASGVIVETGPLRFVVRPNFNVFDSVWLDPRGEFDAEARIVRSHRRGQEVILGGELHSSALSVGKMEIEEAGPLRAVVRVEGKHVSSAKSHLDYVARVYAYEGSAAVRVQTTFLHREGDEMTTPLGPEEVRLVLPLAEPGEAVRFSMGGSDRDHSGVLSGEEEASIFQKETDLYVLGGRAAGGGRGHVARTGWLAAAGDGGGVGVSLRHFWQLHPKALRVDGRGRVTAALWPEEAGPMRIYPGMAKTHDLLYVFYGRRPPEDLAQRLMAFQRPLRAVIPPAYVCRETRVFYDLPERDPAVYRPEFRSFVGKWDAHVDRSLEQVLLGRERKGAFSSGIPPGKDEYGMWNFGCGTQAQKGTPTDYDHTYWSNNYYDMPHAMFLEFARSGDLRLLETGIEAVAHMADVDVCHWIPGESMRNGLGSARVTPGIQHVISYGVERPVPTRDSDMYSSGYWFQKTQSLFEAYYWTGDRRFLDVALLSADHVLARGTPGCHRTEPRTGGLGTIALIAAYRATGERKYIDRAREFIGILRKWQDDCGGGFSVNRYSYHNGLCLEAYRNYYEATGDASILPDLRRGMEATMKKYWRGGRLEGSVCMCTGMMGVTALLTGDDSYLAKGMSETSACQAALDGWRTKTFGQMLRAGSYFLWPMTVDDIRRQSPFFRKLAD